MNRARIAQETTMDQPTKHTYTDSVTGIVSMNHDVGAYCECEECTGGSDPLTMARELFERTSLGHCSAGCPTNMPRVRELAGRLVSALATGCLALALHALPAHAATAHDWHAPVPAGCAEVGHFEDGTIIATCGELGSKVLAFDPDGQTHPAAPYREPGTWRAIS